MAGRSLGGVRAATALCCVALVVLGSLTAVLCYLALTVNSDASPGTTGEVTPSPSADVAPSSPGPAVPEIRDQVIADFQSGDSIPAGARTYDNEAVGSPLELRYGQLAHGAPTGTDAVSSLEVELDAPVSKLAATVQFPGGSDSGSVVLVAWEKSFVKARRAGEPVPDSGLRLVVGPDRWRLTEWKHGERVLKTGHFDPLTGEGQVALYRQGDVVTVVDPDDGVTQVVVAAATRLAGPWACWQLVEDGRREAPARIDEIEAG